MFSLSKNLHWVYTHSKISVKVSLLVFHNIEPFYCLPSSEKEIPSYLCISCLKRNVFLKSINRYRSSKKLMQHKSFTVYLKQLKAEEKFDWNVSREGMQALAIWKICRELHWKRGKAYLIHKNNPIGSYWAISWTAGAIIWN